MMPSIFIVILILILNAFLWVCFHYLYEYYKNRLLQKIGLTNYYETDPLTTPSPFVTSSAIFTTLLVSNFVYIMASLINWSFNVFHWGWFSIVILFIWLLSGANYIYKHLPLKYSNLIFGTLIIGSICYLIASFCSWSFNIIHWNFVSICIVILAMRLIFSFIKWAKKKSSFELYSMLYEDSTSKSVITETNLVTPFDLLNIWKFAFIKWWIYAPVFLLILAINSIFPSSRILIASLATILFGLYLMQIARIYFKLRSKVLHVSTSTMIGVLVGILYFTFMLFQFHILFANIGIVTVGITTTIFAGFQVELIQEATGNRKFIDTNWSISFGIIIGVAICICVSRYLFAMPF